MVEASENWDAFRTNRLDVGWRELWCAIAACPPAHNALLHRRRHPSPWATTNLPQGSTISDDGGVAGKRTDAVLVNFAGDHFGIDGRACKENRDVVARLSHVPLQGVSAMLDFNMAPHSVSHDRCGTASTGSTWSNHEKCLALDAYLEAAKSFRHSVAYSPLASIYALVAVSFSQFNKLGEQAQLSGLSVEQVSRRLRQAELEQQRQAAPDAAAVPSATPALCLMVCIPCYNEEWAEMSGTLRSLSENLSVWRGQPVERTLPLHVVGK